ncbi:MAG: rhomboid family intramembrane serine protease [Spirochaetaceae bacterium]|nr:MAG: rhomboid family intramembrane serine protease [Spirochaetaceae bacterium]
MRISYNAPVTLTYALLSTAALVADILTGRALTAAFFSIGPTLDFSSPLQWLRLVTHVVGHADWTHLISNFAFILLLGPILEEKYGSTGILFMILLTALITGLLNVLLLSTGLLGASGVVFMMILLGSFSKARQGEIPLTFILVALLYLTREVITSVRQENISQFAHVVGGICGSLFGLWKPGRSG